MLFKSQSLSEKITWRLILIFIFALMLSVGVLLASPSKVLADKTLNPVNVEQLLQLLPNGDRWKKHLS